MNHIDSAGDRRLARGSGRMKTSGETSPGAKSRLQVKALRPTDAAAGALVLSRSHASYPSFRHLYPDERRRRRVLRHTFRPVIADAARLETALGAFDGETLVGVAAWLPPTRFPWSPARKLRAAPSFLMVFAAAPRSFPAFMAVGRRSEEVHPRVPHWYLEVMGVDPAAQGRGAGGALLRPVLERADATSTACYLETADENNVAYYERFGFSLMGEVQLVPGGPPHWAMCRAPVAAAPQEQEEA